MALYARLMPLPSNWGRFPDSISFASSVRAYKFLGFCDTYGGELRSSRIAPLYDGRSILYGDPSWDKSIKVDESVSDSSVFQCSDDASFIDVTLHGCFDLDFNDGNVWSVLPSESMLELLLRNTVLLSKSDALAMEDSGMLRLKSLLSYKNHMDWLSLHGAAWGADMARRSLDICLENIMANLTYTFVLAIPWGEGGTVCWRPLIVDSYPSNERASLLPSSDYLAPRAYVPLMCSAVDFELTSDDFDNSSRHDCANWVSPIKRSLSSSISGWTVVPDGYDGLRWDHISVTSDIIDNCSDCSYYYNGDLIPLPRGSCFGIALPDGMTIDQLPVSNSDLHGTFVDWVYGPLNEIHQNAVKLCMENFMASPDVEYVKQIATPTADNVPVWAEAASLERRRFPCVPLGDYRILDRGAIEDPFWGRRMHVDPPDNINKEHNLYVNWNDNDFGGAFEPRALLENSMLHHTDVDPALHTHVHVGDSMPAFICDSGYSPFLSSEKDSAAGAVGWLSYLIDTESSLSGLDDWGDRGGVPEIIATVNE